MGIGVSIGLLPNNLDFVRCRFGVDFACRSLGSDCSRFNCGLVLVNCGLGRDGGASEIDVEK